MRRAMFRAASVPPRRSSPVTIDRASLEPVLADRLGPVLGCVAELERRFTAPVERSRVLRALRTVVEAPGRLYPGSAAEWSTLGRLLAACVGADEAVAAIAILERKLFTFDHPHGAQRRRLTRLATAVASVDAGGVSRAAGALGALLDLADQAPASVLRAALAGHADLAVLAAYRPISKLPPQRAAELAGVLRVVEVACAGDHVERARALVDGLNSDTEPPPLRRSSVSVALADALATLASGQPLLVALALEALAALAPIPLALDRAAIDKLVAALGALAPEHVGVYVSQLARLVREFSIEAVPFVLGELAPQLAALASTAHLLGDGEASAAWLDALVTCAAWSPEAIALVTSGVGQWAERIPPAHHTLLASTLARLGPILPEVGRETLDRLAETAHALGPSGQIEAFLHHAAELGAAKASTVAGFVALCAAAAELGRADHVAAISTAFAKERIERTHWAVKLPAALVALSERVEPWGSAHWCAALDPCLSAAGSSPESALALARGLHERLPDMPIERRLPYLAAVHDLVHHYGVRFVGYALGELPARYA